jgi:hypothetical protein
MTGNAHGESAVGDTVEWYTPPAIFEALGLTFDLDPASPGAVVVPWIPVAQHYTLIDNGLWREWHGRVWLNPPYGQTVPDFLVRLVEHGHGIALVFSRTETQWWHDTAPKADSVCFIKGRVAFIRADGYSAPSQMGSALIAFGEDCAAAVRTSGLGWTP